MKPKYLLLASALSAMTLTAPAAACDFDGMPGMGGFHRMNPFAKSLGGFGGPRPLPQPEATAERADKADKKDSADRKAKDRKERAKAIEVTPVREWELDFGNGTISEEDKATFT